LNSSVLCFEQVKSNVMFMKKAEKQGAFSKW